MSYARRIDGNHAEIVRVLTSCGATVLDLSRVGCGCPEICVGYLGENTFMEIKANIKKKLTPAQVKFWERWKGKVVRINSPDEALIAIGATKF
jgi:hypothetical protein